MSTEVRTQPQFQSFQLALGDSLSRPVYLRVAKTPTGEFKVEQVMFLTADQLAELAHVERRTVYSWIERADKIGLKFYRPPGSRAILFDLNEVLDWLKGNHND